jgi:hypothetical protein
MIANDAKSLNRPKIPFTYEIHRRIQQSDEVQESQCMQATKNNTVFCSLHVQITSRSSDDLPPQSSAQQAVAYCIAIQISYALASRTNKPSGASDAGSWHGHVGDPELSTAGTLHRGVVGQEAVVEGLDNVAAVDEDR